tara:strand:- start:669 stop:914 length:246 start_codon:yes stop_codon:yes gene_type:complete
MSVFGKHRVRNTFYHIIAVLYLATMAVWMNGWIESANATAIGFLLFVIDYLAEMYDPNPKDPGSWFKRHFHRFLDNGDEDD